MSDIKELDDQALEQVSGGCNGINGYTHYDVVTQSVFDADNFCVGNSFNFWDGSNYYVYTKQAMIYGAVMFTCPNRAQNIFIGQTHYCGS